MHFSLKIKNLILELFIVAIMAPGVMALPFNDDMVDVQPRTGSVMRPLPEHSVPIGGSTQKFSSKQEMLDLTNPITNKAASAAIGKNLFAINCSPCHGDISKTPYTPGPVAAKFMTPPDIGSNYYKSKSDGYIYGTIDFGGLAVMPPLGWKLSPTEHWDIINYIRSIQELR